ncbi:cell division protein ZipA [Vibrio sp. 10N.261.51.F12]|uniref:cell division protein ZipA n=1 Tax=Vibrio sp. 10N.261.51.F12 TaxID=3229679 RepID=UPI003553E4EC
MQELRFVLIIVGALAIAALLFHGLWSSKKEGQKKFGDRPLGNIDEKSDDDDQYVAPEDDFEIVRKVRTEPDFGLSQQTPAFDPLDDVSDHHERDYEATRHDTAPGFVEPRVESDDIPSFSAKESVEEITPLEPTVTFSSTDIDQSDFDKPAYARVENASVVEENTSLAESSVALDDKPHSADQVVASPTSKPVEPVVEEPEEPAMQVIVMNVHCAGSEPFVGTKLFDSMRQNGLIYGDMDIFHRHADLSGTGKVLFSVANMMQPGTLHHDDPDTFTTKGISFFMTLPCFGEAEQNFKLMLRTAQQIADDVSGNVLDDQRNLLTPSRIDAYKKQIQDFSRAKSGA